MSFTDDEYLELKAKTQHTVEALTIIRDEEEELKLRLEYGRAEVRRVQALMDHMKDARQIAHERAIDSTVKLSETINERIKESNVPEGGAELAFVESLCDVVWGKPQPPPT